MQTFTRFKQSRMCKQLNVDFAVFDMNEIEISALHLKGSVIIVIRKDIIANFVTKEDMIVKISENLSTK